ncbi:MAG: hypothetical protein M3019_12175 [Candidatus Dormibacteraeota bacterium]|nr:hypothetical protein [Candidatus Dormibacteraeota bacterium]MDQ6946668.1 hypothetical protein [Actinomycetota bacterium]
MSQEYSRAQSAPCPHGFSRPWGSDAYFVANPFLTDDACKRLVAAGVAFVGIDSLNIDDIADPARPVTHDRAPGRHPDL